MIAVTVSKRVEERETRWLGHMSAERVRKAVADAILTELGLSPHASDLTIVIPQICGSDVEFHVTQDHDQWRKRFEAGSQQAEWLDANAR